MKIIYLLQSRKFWAALVALIVVLLGLDMGEAAQAEAAVTISAGIMCIYALAVAIEDGLRNLARGHDDDGDEPILLE